MHKWLVKNEWVIDAKNKFQMCMTYLSFFFIPGVALFALTHYFLALKTHKSRK